MSVERDDWIAAAWGLAEGTLFFIVPDVFLSWLALERPRRACVASLFATLGALCGGALMFAWGAAQPEAAREVLVALPGIRPELLDSVRSSLAEHGPLALFGGPLRGVPYKLYAAEWGGLGGNGGNFGGGLAGFLLMSVPARALRFLLVVGLASLVRRRLLARCSLKACRALHVALWLAFYAWYFQVMRG